MGEKRTFTQPCWATHTTPVLLFSIVLVVLARCWDPRASLWWVAAGEVLARLGWDAACGSGACLAEESAMAFRRGLRL